MNSPDSLGTGVAINLCVPVADLCAGSSILLQGQAFSPGFSRTQHLVSFISFMGKESLSSVTLDKRVSKDKGLYCGKTCPPGPQGE